jgi:hypothetical protein
VEFGSAYDVRSRSAVDNDDRFSRWTGGEGSSGGGVAPKDNIRAVTEGEDANGGCVALGEDEGGAVFVGALVLGEDAALSNDGGFQYLVGKQRRLRAGYHKPLGVDHSGKRLEGDASGTPGSAGGGGNGGGHGRAGGV